MTYTPTYETKNFNWRKLVINNEVTNIRARKIQRQLNHKINIRLQSRPNY